MGHHRPLGVPYSRHRPPFQNSPFKQRLSQNKWERLIPTTLCTGAKVDKVGSPWQWPRTLLPVIQGTRHTDFEHKLGEEKWDRGPFVNIHLIKILFFFHAIFWLFPVILFLKGECNVPPKISVTLKKKKKNPTKQTNQQKKKNLFEDPGGNSILSNVFPNSPYCFILSFFTEEKNGVYTTT